MMKALLDAGADVNARTAKGTTALSLCATSGKLEAVRTLIHYRAEYAC